MQKVVKYIYSEHQGKMSTNNSYHPNNIYSVLHTSHKITHDTLRHILNDCHNKSTRKSNLMEVATKKKFYLQHANTKCKKNPNTHNIINYY